MKRILFILVMVILTGCADEHDCGDNCRVEPPIRLDLAIDLNECESDIVSGCWTLTGAVGLSWVDMNNNGKGFTVYIDYYDRNGFIWSDQFNTAVPWADTLVYVDCNTHAEIYVRAKGFGGRSGPSEVRAVDLSVWNYADCMGL